MLVLVEDGGGWQGVGWVSEVVTAAGRLRGGSWGALTSCWRAAALSVPPALPLAGTDSLSSGTLCSLVDCCALNSLLKAVPLLAPSLVAALCC